MSIYRGIQTELTDESLGDGSVCDAKSCMNFPEGMDTFPKYEDGPYYFCCEHRQKADAALARPEQPRMTADLERQRRFASHFVDEEQATRAAEIRHACLALSERIARLVPSGREQATALTNLEQVMFFSVAGIARETV